MPRRRKGQDTGIPADPDSFVEAIEKFRARVPMTRAEYDRLEAGQQERAFFVSEVATADLVAEVMESVDRAVAAGATLADFKATAGQTLIDHWGGDKPGRLETIFRTNVLTAYNGGRHAVLTAPAVRKARPFWRYDAITDDRTTEICESLDGKVFAADDPFVDSHTPPNHYNCRSVWTPLSDEEANEEGGESEPPETEPQEGFGLAPSVDGTDWTPEAIGYPEEIRPEVERRLGKKK